MILTKLSLVNFRNYRDAEVSFCNTVNCFAGPNGSGKTNILEAIHYLAMTKGYFSATDTQNLKHDTRMFIVRGEFSDNSEQDDVVLCSLRHGHKKQFLVNNNEYDRLGDHIGKFPVVVIAPADHNIITGGSDVRRRFMDSIISQTDRSYLFTLISYNQALMQRNALLKKFSITGLVDKPSLEVWNERLCELAGPIYTRREEFIKHYHVMFTKHYNFISGGNENIDIQYISTLQKESLLNQLERNMVRDSEVKHTTAGIHKDDISISLGGYPVKKYASQGQQKSVTISLKLAQYSFLQKNGSAKPMVLLDDIFDKLDDQRVMKLMELVGNGDFGQLFVTDTSDEKMTSTFRSVGIDCKVFHVLNGEVRQQSPQLA
jgi:DNA replication and repair protein RecF